MEAIGSVLSQLMNGQTEGRAIRRPAPEFRASSLPTYEPETDAEDMAEYTIHPDDAKAKGYIYTAEPPEPEPCQFCGKQLYHYGAILPGQRRVFIWFAQPERCTCDASKEYNRKLREEKRAAEEAERQREKQERIQRNIEKLFRDSGIGGRFQTRTFDRFDLNEENRTAYMMAKKYADNFSAMLPKTDERGNVRPPEKERNGLFISGTKGTGKTHLATAIANQLIKSGTPVICMTMIDLLNRIRKTYDRSEDETEAQILKIYEEVPLLVIDDIGTEPPTKWGIAQIFSIVNARYEAYMPMIITTNYSAAGLVSRMTPEHDDGYTATKIISRLQEMCAGIEMIWEDWRTR